MTLTDEEAAAIINDIRRINGGKFSFMELLILGRSGNPFPCPMNDLGFPHYWLQYAVDHRFATRDIGFDNDVTLTEAGIEKYREAIHQRIKRHGMPMELNPAWGTF